MARFKSSLRPSLQPYVRQGFVRPGQKTGPIGIRWYSSYWEEDIASGLISADMSSEREGWFRLQLGNVEQ
jgi:hypothetical protein